MTTIPIQMRTRESPQPRTNGASDSIALRAFAILEYLAHASVPMSLDDITHAMGLPKATVFRILQMLQSAGLLLREQNSKRYTVGPRLLSFAVELWRNEALRSPWRRALEQAVEETGESCNLTLLENNEVLYLDRVETRQPLRLHLEVGTRVPLHCTASGKLFLSQMASEKARELLGPEPYKRYTRTTITSFAALQPELERSRRTMVGVHDGELFADSVAIAVPVLDASGRVFAAVAAHAPSSRVDLQGMQNFLPALRRAAAAISATMTPRPEPKAELEEQPVPPAPKQGKAVAAAAPTKRRRAA